MSPADRKFSVIAPVVFDQSITLRTRGKTERPRGDKFGGL